MSMAVNLAASGEQADSRLADPIHNEYPAIVLSAFRLSMAPS
jgi:hypothetical protein